MFHIKISKYAITNAIYFDQWSRILQFCDLEVSLSIILIIGLFCLNHMMVIFSKFEKNFISQQTLKVPYIYDVHIEVGWSDGWEGGGLKICHVLADFFCFEAKYLLLIFADGGNWRSPNWLYFMNAINIWPLNSLKLQ